MGGTLGARGYPLVLPSRELLSHAALLRIGSPIGFRQPGATLPLEVLGDGAPQYGRTAVANHFLISIEPLEQVFVEGDLYSLHIHRL
jgi:hypothetical protein